VLLLTPLLTLGENPSPPGSDRRSRRPERGHFCEPCAERARRAAVRSGQIPSGGYGSLNSPLQRLCLAQWESPCSATKLFNAEKHLLDVGREWMLPIHSQVREGTVTFCSVHRALRSTDPRIISHHATSARHAEGRPSFLQRRYRQGDVTKSSTVRVMEIAELLGLTHQRASKIADEPGFPAPVGREGQSRLWDRREVAAWAKVWRREKPWR
jgi:hypothetical protein